MDAQARRGARGHPRVTTVRAPVPGTDVEPLGSPRDRARPRDRPSKPPFRYAAYTRVGFSETDAQGVVYYGRYMPYFDLARTEYHRHLGRVDLGRRRLRDARDDGRVPRRRRFDDLLEVFVRVERIGTTSITYDHAAYRIDDGRRATC